MMKFYRYEESVFTDERVKVLEKIFISIKETVHGYWIVREFNYRTLIPSKPRWISKTSRKRYAYPTKKEALVSFLARKKMQLFILETRILRASEAKAIANVMLEQLNEAS